MATLMPVNLSVADAHADAGLSTEEDSLPQAPSAADLDNWDQENYSLDVHVAATLGFPVATVTGEGEHQVLIFGVSRWKDVTQGIHSYRFGVALRVAVSITNLKGNIAATLPMVAAKVEVGDAQASARLLIRGYKGSTIADQLPSWDSFGVDSYNDYKTKVSQLQQEIFKDESNMQPELLATTVHATQVPQSSAAVGTVYALHAIAEGVSLVHAVDKLTTGDSDVIAAVHLTYQDRIGTDERATPTAEQRQSALGQLNGVHIRDHWFDFFR